jgi:small subunit ribosomal protein S8
MLNDTLSNALNRINSAERTGKDTVKLEPSSKVLERVLTILNEHGYAGSYEKPKLNLLGKINNCGAIKPRMPISYKDIEKFEKRFLPARDFGILIISTPQGMMTNEEARKRKTGGKLIAFCY